MAAATVLPPLRPRATIYGTGSAVKRSLLSAALTNPTGTPTTSAGERPASISSHSVKSAVGALPSA